MQAFDMSFPWVLFKLEKEFFALSSRYVQSMIELPNVTLAPYLPRSVRGFMNYNNEAVRLIDMRVKMGFKPLNEEINEFIELMDAREQDHKQWLSTLAECIHEGKEFTLTLDPKKCKFGQWYYDFLPKLKDSEMLGFLLRQFEHPHNTLHGVATQAFDLLHESGLEAAIDLIEETEDQQLRKMIDLFSETKNTYKRNQREIAIVLSTDVAQYPTALLVDEIIAVEPLSENHWNQFGDARTMDSSELTTGIGEFSETGLSAITLDISHCIVV